jgi:hypothetical protein
MWGERSYGTSNRNRQVFFRAADPASLARWYVEMLGLPIDEQGYTVIRSFGGETLT